MINVKRLILVFSVLFLGACGQAPIVPDSPKETLALIQTMRAAAYDTIADLSQSGSINRAQHDVLMAEMGEAEQAINLANAALKVGSMDTHIEQLRVARSILVKITRDLAAKRPRSRTNQIGGIQYG